MPSHTEEKSRPALEPVCISIDDARRYLGGISRWEMYRLLREQRVRALKQGRRTLPIVASLKEHAASLPEAKFAAPRVRRAPVREAHAK